MLLVTKKDELRTLGLNSSVFLIFYGLLRIICEFFREPDYQLGFVFSNITTGQLLSLPLIVIGTLIMFKKRKC